MRTAFGICWLLNFAAVACADDSDEIARLARELGHPKFAVREEATRRLREFGPRVIPELTKVLAGGNAEARRRADLILMDIDPLWRNRRELRNDYAARRREAIRDLVGFRVPQALDSVLGQLAVESDSECLLAQLAFVRHLGDKSAGPVLADRLLDPMPRPSAHDTAILRALATAGSAKQALEMRAYCARHLIRAPRIGDQPSDQYWKITDAAQNVALADALSTVGECDGVVPLLLMNSVSYGRRAGEEVHAAALRGLIKIGPKAVPDLMSALESFAGPGRSLITPRRLVIEALGRFGDVKAIPALTKTLADPEPLVAAEAALALDRLGSDKGATWILARVQPADRAKISTQEMFCALEALRACRDASIKPVCEQMLREGEPWRRWYAAEALAGMGETSGLAFLRSQLDDVGALPYVTEPLIHLADSSCVPALIRHARTGDRKALQVALPALAKLGTPAAEQALIDLANGPQRPPGAGEVRRDAIRALGELRTRRAVESLIGLLADRDDSVRELAMASLGENVGVNLVGAMRWQAWWEHHKETFRR